MNGRVFTRLLARSFFLAAALFFAPLKAAEDPALFQEIGEMQASLTSITGLRFKHPVPYSVINKEQLRRYLEDRVKPHELRAEELTLKMLGMLPQDFDLRQTAVDLVTEQAAAFYDYNKKKLFLLSAGGGSDDRIALVHELAHALADQHFHLAKYIHEGLRSDDGSTARLAVMEGQASWLMTAYLARLTGGPLAVPDTVIERMTRSIEESAAQYPVFAKAPPYIRASLIFPYTAGMAFQNALYGKIGQQSFTDVFTHPPASTQQIIHPARYLAHADPKNPSPPRISPSHDFRRLAQGSLGELDYRVLLSQYTSQEDGNRVAAHLVGSSYLLLEHKQAKYPVLAFASTWDSEDTARQYLDLYRRVMKGKWKTYDVRSESPTRLEGLGDSGRFELWIDGTTVNHLEGLH